MLKRLASLIAGSALLLLVAGAYHYINRLNALALAQQQTQHQMAQWREQSQQNNDYRELKTAVQHTAARTETLARKLNDANTTHAEQLNPLNEQLKVLEGQVQTLSASYQHLQQQSATRIRATAKHPVPSPLWAAKAPFSLIGSEFRAGQQFAVIAPSSYRSLSQLQLVAPGDSVQGWQLLQLDGNRATFRKDGQRLTLNAGG